MEITNDIKAKVFAAYLGQQAFRICDCGDNCSCYNSNGEVGIFTQIENMGSIFWVDYENNKNAVNGKFGNSNMTLILKPLSEITDEDAIEAAQCVMGGFEALKNGKAFINDLMRGKEMALNFHPFNTLKAFQYLQSKGYDLPHYLLGGKTLHEAGLAIYE